MRWLLFLSRLAFICGIFFILSLSLRISDWAKDEDITSTIIIIGYFMGMIIVPVTNLCYGLVFLMKKKLKKYVPGWLVIANFLFLLLLLYYIFYLNDPSLSSKIDPLNYSWASACFFCCQCVDCRSDRHQTVLAGKIFGAHPVDFTLFGQSGLSFTLTCGVLLWPLEFVITDIVNEYYGPKAVRRISFTAVILIAYAFLMYFLAIRIPPADAWINSSSKQGVDNIQTSFHAIFGQNNRIIIGSIVAFLVSQIVDVTVFHKIKRMTGDKHLWLRATGSTLVSQIVDSYIVLFIAFQLR